MQEWFENLIGAPEYQCILLAFTVAITTAIVRIAIVKFKENKEEREKEEEKPSVMGRR